MQSQVLRERSCYAECVLSVELLCSMRWKGDSSFVVINHVAKPSNVWLCGARHAFQPPETEITVNVSCS